MKVVSNYPSTCCEGIVYFGNTIASSQSRVGVLNVSAGESVLVNIVVILRLYI